MSFFDAMILGIIQGLTEFLPVSSSGHLVILENLLNIRTDTDVLFHVLLHFGTLIAICLVFKNDLFRMLVETIHIFQDLTANFKIYIDNKMHSAQTTPYRKILCPFLIIVPLFFYYYFYSFTTYAFRYFYYSIKCVFAQIFSCVFALNIYNKFSFLVVCFINCYIFLFSEYRQ